jgi:soluble lytic murein transglycosylase-like protein
VRSGSAALDKNSPPQIEPGVKTIESAKKPAHKSEYLRSVLTERDRIEESIQKAAAKYSLPPGLIRAVIRAESNFQVDAVSRAGAKGLMQLMPATAKELGVTDSFDINQNIDGGAKYLRQMLDRFGGNVRKALAAYNAGPGTVIKYNGRVPYPETRQYVKRVLRFSGQTV